MLVYGLLCEMDVRGSRNGASLSKEAQCGGPFWRAPLLATLKDMLGLLLLEPEDINLLAPEFFKFFSTPCI
jgi:hypothetical protein